MLVFPTEAQRQAYLKREAKAVVCGLQGRRILDTTLSQTDREWLTGLLVGFAERMSCVVTTKDYR